MGIKECFERAPFLLMEGALGERLKREYHLIPDKDIALASLLYEEAGAAALASLWKDYIAIAWKYRLPFLATTPTRRANQECLKKAGFNASLLSDHAAFLQQIKKSSKIEMYIGGLMGCKGDAYTGEGALSSSDAYHFHRWQAQMFRQTDIDFLYAGIMPVCCEAIGMAQAMAETGLPYIISFTIQRNGCLIDGTPIAEAIQRIDQSVVSKPLCYMSNCIHPDLLYEALIQPMNRTPIVHKHFLGIQANTSALPYIELDHMQQLAACEPMPFARSMIRLREVSAIKLFGGCCGTDYTHMEELARHISMIKDRIEASN